jgi:hypothetical protein
MLPMRPGIPDQRRGDGPLQRRAHSGVIWSSLAWTWLGIGMAGHGVDFLSTKPGGSSMPEIDNQQHGTKTVKIRYVPQCDHKPGDRLCSCARCREPRTVRVVTVEH